ncbi:MAG: LamG-like jellyroll fold domain-containing protein [Aliiglaciecola sp.]|uniref:LamG-like jellyroll fold domain-containing protein n=1 Tax=Aliiglaciecola sp. TaxID=1872441 RepID=UPI0032987C2C
MKFRTTCYAALTLGLLSCNSHAEPKADWMQGNWGISFRISGGDVSQQESHVNEYQVRPAVEQIASIPGLTWLQVNLTNGAFGDRFIVPVPEVEAINPNAAPNSINDLYDPTLPGRDLFEQIALGLQAKGIKVVVYIATQGPGMLKHGAEKSMDYDPSIIDETDGSACKSTKPNKKDADTQVYCSASMNRWRDYVLVNYPSTSLHHSFQLALVNIVETLSLRYGTLIDGWWFDHATYGDYALLPDAARAGNSDAVVALGLAEDVHLGNNPEVQEDYTGGHPTPLTRTISSSDTNLPMLTAIEATENGYFPAVGDDVDAVGHMFMPLQQSWNGGTVVFSEAKGSDWLNRALNAKGAYSWALSHEGSISGGEPLLISQPQVKLMTRIQINRGKQLHLNLKGADGSTAYDDSVNQYSATVNGATFVDDTSRGTVASFTEGSNLTIDSYTGVLGDSARTTTAWIKTTDNKGDIIQWGNAAPGEQWRLRLVSGKLRLILGDATVIGTTSLNNDQWHHIAVVAPDNAVDNIKIYVNGILENTSVNGNTSNVNTVANSDVQIGGSYTGLIDKVVIHDRALVETEVDYLANSVDADIDLEVAYDLRFNELSGNTVTDHSIYERTSTNNGALVGVYDNSRDSEVYSFDGNSTVVADRYNGVNEADPRTVMAWIKTTNGNGTIIKWGNTDVVKGEQYVIRLKNDALRVSITGGRLTGTTKLNDSEWHHIAIVSPDEQLSNTKLYIDGVLEPTSFAGTHSTINTYTVKSKSMNVEIGADFIGEMDDVLIHQRPLKLFEIKAMAGLQ